MYTTAILNKPRYTVQDILEQVDQADIFQRVGIAKTVPGKKFCSPFREDTHGDCRFSVGDDHKLRYLDPARGIVWDVFEAVMATQQLSFPAALEWIADTFLLCRGNDVATFKQPVTPLPAPTPTKKLIQIKRKGFCGADWEFWRQFNISKKEIHLGRVHAISDYWIDGRHFPAPKKAYAYEEEDGFKLYFPENPHKYRFLGNSKALFCYELLPQVGDLLLITSSKKDALTLLSFGYHAVAPQGEGMDIPSNRLWELKQRFATVLVFYDNDAAGVSLAAEKVMKWQVTGSIMLPPGPKDPSDYCKQHGAAATATILTTLTHEYRSCRP